VGRELRAFKQPRSFYPSRQAGYDELEPSFPPSRAHGDPLPAFKGSFARGSAHFWDAAERLTKRQAVLLAMAGAIAVVAAAGFSYWTAMQGFVKEPTTNQLRAEITRHELEIKILQATLASVQQQKQSADDKIYHQGEDIAALKKALEPKRGR
jgi:hypothetical protein